MSDLDDLARAAHGPTRRSYSRSTRPPKESGEVSQGFQFSIGAAPILFVVIVLAILFSMWVYEKRVQQRIDESQREVQKALELIPQK